jgi:hypothetical protein
MLPGKRTAAVLAGLRWSNGPGRYADAAARFLGNFDHSTGHDRDNVIVYRP